MFIATVPSLRHGGLKGDLIFMETPNYHLISFSLRRPVCLLLAILCCMLLSTLTHAQDFTVPGTSGRHWVDTGLNIPDGTLLQLSADGRVDVGAGWGVYGPGGTTGFANVPGYPAETRFRYGLVARLTASRTSPEDDTREDWSFGEGPKHCAEQGGHLWLTVNDDDPGNNTGAFIVHVTQTACAGQPERGRFRVTFTGFIVNNATTENILSTDGAGDEVFALVNFAEISSSQVLGGLQRRQSLIYGDTSGHTLPTTIFGTPVINSLRQPTVIQAGHASSTGGLRNPDRIGAGGDLPAVPRNADAATRARLIPMILWEGELRQGGPSPNAVVMLPTIWENDNVPDVLNVWQRQADEFITTFARNSARFITGRTERPLVEQVDTVFRTIPQRNDFDRPIGMDGNAFDPLSAEPEPATFNPAVMLLTFTSAQAAANSTTQGRGVVEITYRDGERYGRGIYTIFLRVDRLP
jgi:hypothetical protein